MLMDTPYSLLYLSVGSFLIGWIVGRVSAYLGNRFKAKRRDPRDDRIRSLEAEQRVALTKAEKAGARLEDKKTKLAETTQVTEACEATIIEQQQVIEQLRSDLKESVIKTRQLRAELTDRATENVKSEVKLREVETELSIAQASTDLLATGALDYSESSDEGDDGARRVRVGEKSCCTESKGSPPVPDP